MSGIGTSELILLFVVGLLVLGPERLPRVASQVGRWVGRARREADRLRRQLERETALSAIGKARPDEPPQSMGSGADPTPSGTAGAEPERPRTPTAGV
jgi:sec-independent protein translocase protein TatB